MQALTFLAKRESSLFWITTFFTATVFFVPISSTAKSICLIASILFILSNKAYYNAIKAVLSQRWCQSGYALFFIALIACTWSPATLPEKILVVEKYSKLLYLPILVVGFTQERTRYLAIHAFLMAMFLTCVISLLKFSGVLHYPGMNQNPGQVFHNHIMTGHMMSFAAYLAGFLCLQHCGWKRISYGFLAVFYSYQILFINFGRTGLVTYALLMGLFFLQTFTWRKALVAIFLGSTLLLTAYFQNTKVHERVHLVYSEWRNYQANHDKDTAIGYRLQFHEFAKSLFLRNPGIGNGTASFTHSFSEEKPVPSWNRRLLEPHSQYWLIAAEFGILGLLTLGIFWVTLFLAVLQLESMRPIALAVLIPFFIGNCTDSLLLYSGSGYFFLLFIALCLGESKFLRKFNAVE